MAAIPPLPIVKTKLLVDAPSIKTGDTIWAGVEFTMPPHWHIYAKDPGDAGVPTSYAWTLPKGITAGEIQWPTPEKTTDAGLTTYGYSNIVILPVPLKITATPGAQQITVKATWLACEEVCIPESATLTADLPHHSDEESTKLNAARYVPAADAQPLLPILLLAFIGGLLLNIMPCVLPILSLKALTLVKKAHVSPRLAQQHGVAYTIGVVVSFLAIAIVLLGLRASGAAIGWGFQLQSPIFVGGLTLLMFAVAANFAGLFELPVLFGGVQTDHESRRGTLLTGVLAVAVATPCTAPFMASAIGATLLLPMFYSLSVFAAMGFGMAAPFLLISYWPAALRLLPKPGKWMQRFRQILAIPMALTALWLASVFWQLLHMDDAKETLQDKYSIVAAEPYSPDRLAALRAQHQPVLLDATAAWCLTCKVNEHVALQPDRVQQFLHDHHVTLMVADWTSRNAEITSLLAEFQRNGVPLYVVYPAEGEPVVLPQVLTPQIIMDAVETKTP